jgi:hypothetical protein
MPTYKAKQRLSIGGRKVEPGTIFEATEDAVQVALARGWIEPAEEEPKRKTAERATARSAKRVKR